jgi:hypothetical protein
MEAGAAARWELLGAAALFSTGGARIKACSLSGWHVAGLRSAWRCWPVLVLVPAARRLPSGREMLVGLAYAACLVAFVVSNKLTTAGRRDLPAVGGAAVHAAALAAAL